MDGTGNSVSLTVLSITFTFILGFATIVQAWYVNRHSRIRSMKTVNKFSKDNIVAQYYLVKIQQIVRAQAQQPPVSAQAKKPRVSAQVKKP